MEEINLNKWDYVEFKDKFIITVKLEEPVELREDHIIFEFTFNLPKHLNNGHYQMDWTTERVEKFIDGLNNGSIPLKMDNDYHFEFTVNPEDIGFNIGNIKK